MDQQGRAKARWVPIWQPAGRVEINERVIDEYVRMVLGEAAVYRRLGFDGAIDYVIARAHEEDFITDGMRHLTGPFAR